MSPAWSFAYAPATPFVAGGPTDVRWVAAFAEATTSDRLKAALETAALHGEAECVISRAPLFWYRIELSEPIDRSTLQAALEHAGSLRYVTSENHGSLELPPSLSFEATAPVEARGWRARPARRHARDRSGGKWFLDDRTGVGAEWSICGTGAGIRLAVIDDEAREADALDLDALVQIGPDAPPRASTHGASMVAWAVGTRGRPEAGLPPFRGVAPDASPRLYAIPKPDTGVLWLALALARAAADGADVILCATYVEGLTSPLLDDALEFASRAGRGGRGTAVVFPTGREISSPQGSREASLTLRLSDPASDPRVLCVAPSGRNGGWFLWLDKSGKLRPFGNRGPAVRVAAPGDDIAFAFSPRQKLAHAESSGASANAAGAAALVLGNTPSLTVSELYAVLTRTATHADLRSDAPLASRADVQPEGRDADGHDAKCGFGRLSALKACLAVSDPVSAILVDLGDVAAAAAYLGRLRSASWAYSAALAEHAARAQVADPDLRHILTTAVRHLRLVCGRTELHAAHGPGSLLRLLGIALRRITERSPPELLAECRRLEAGLRGVLADRDAALATEARLVQLWADLLEGAPPQGRSAGVPMAEDAKLG